MLERLASLERNDENQSLGIFGEMHTLGNVPSKIRSSTRPFAQWNLILAHLQQTKTLWKHENKKLFELNVYVVHVLIRF